MYHPSTCTGIFWAKIRDRSPGFGPLLRLQPKRVEISLKAGRLGLGLINRLIVQASPLRRGIL